MIRLIILDYSKSNDVDMVVTRYVNKNLEIIIRVLLDMLNDDGGFDLEGFLPRSYLDRKPKESRELVDELYELVKSDVLRDYIKPKYEYLLFSIIEWWGDIAEEEENPIPKPLTNELLNNIRNEESYILEDDRNFVLEEISSYESYYYIFFNDYDFLSSSLSSMVTLYLRSSKAFELFFSDVDLHEYEDLIPADLRELYLDKRQAKDKDISDLDIEVDIILEILFVIQSLEQRVVEINSRGEVQISNDIYNSLIRVLEIKFGIQCTREMTIGRANKGLGETDLYLYKNKIMRRDIAIIENKNINKFKSQYQQLLGYLNQNFKFGVTISINREFKLEYALEKIEKELIDIQESDDKFRIINIVKPFEQEHPYVIKSQHIIPEDSTRVMSIYHLILNLNDSERAMIAKKARGIAP